MPRGIDYDKEIKKTPEWKALYGIWKRLHREKTPPEFTTFVPFYEWSIQNGFFVGARLL